MSELTSDRAAFPRRSCCHCDDVIGMYEPLAVETEGGLHETSLAAEPDLHTADHACYHRACYAEASRGRS